VLARDKGSGSYVLLDDLAMPALDGVGSQNGIGCRALIIAYWCRLILMSLSSCGWRVHPSTGPSRRTSTDPPRCRWWAHHINQISRMPVGLRVAARPEGTRRTLRVQRPSFWSVDLLQLDEETDADTTVQITKAGLLAAFSREATVEELAGAGGATIEGNIENLAVLAGLLDTFDQGFPIVPAPTRWLSPDSSV